MIDTKTAIEKITNGEFDNLFTDIYIDSSMIDYQKKRYVHAIEQYETIFCPDKVAIFSAPGRSEVCGNHTDHQHGMVLATSINLDTIAVSAKNNNDVVRFVSDGYDMITLNINDLEVNDDEAGTTVSLIRGVLRGLKDHGYKIGGFNAYVTSDVLIGATRMLEGFREKKKCCYAEYLPEKIRAILDEQEEKTRCTVLFSGDTGFYSGAKKLADILKKDGYEVQIFPGISSVIYLAAKLGKSWEDAKILSMHGRSQNFIHVVANHEKTFLILGKSAGKEICEKLKYYHLEQVTVSVGNHLSYPDEEIVIKKGNKLQAEDFGDLTTILIENPKPEKRTGIHLADEELIRGSVPMTKEEVRTVSIAKLKLTKNAVIYDVGAGTGSVSIEAALQGENLRVYAIEKNPEGAELIRKNMQKFRADQIQVIEGVAPEALEALEMPTHAFIGGSTGQLKEIIQCIKKKNPDVRIVINAISLETVKEAMEAMEEGLLADPEIIELNVSKSKKLGCFHMMTGLNPIYIISDGGDTE